MAAAGGGGGKPSKQVVHKKLKEALRSEKGRYRCFGGCTIPYRLYHTNIAFEWYVKEGRYFSTHTSPRRTSYKSMDIPIPPWVRSLEDF